MVDETESNCGSTVFLCSGTHCPVVLAILLFLQIPQAFIPTQDRASVFTIVEEPEGVTIEYIMEKVEQIYSSVPEVESYLTLGGFSPRGCGKLTLSILKGWRF